MPRARRWTLTEDQQKVLEKSRRGGSTPYRLVKRSPILLAAQGYANRTIARRLRINPITVARWRSRFLLLGTGGIRRRRHDSIPAAAPRELTRRNPSTRPCLSVPRASRAGRPAPSAVRSASATPRCGGFGRLTPSTPLGLGWDARSRPAIPPEVDRPGRGPSTPRRRRWQSPFAMQGRGSFGGTARAAPFAPLPEYDVNERSWMDDLVTTLNLLDHAALKGSARRLLDQDFLSFLQSIRERRSGPEHIQLLAESAGPAPPISLVRWLSRHPEFSARVEVGNASLRQIVVEWFGDASARRPADLPGEPARDCAQRSSDGCERWATRLDRSPGPESRVSTPSGPMVH